MTDFLTDVQTRRQRARIEPRQVGEIHRAHSRQHAVGTEVENLPEMENRLDVPFRPLAVDRRIEGERYTLQADDHQDRESAPRQEIGQGAGRGLHQRGVRLLASVLGNGERMEYMYFVRDTASTLSTGWHIECRT